MADLSEDQRTGRSGGLSRGRSSNGAPGGRPGGSSGPGGRSDSSRPGGFSSRSSGTVRRTVGSGPAATSAGSTSNGGHVIARPGAGSGGSLDHAKSTAKRAEADRDARLAQISNEIGTPSEMDAREAKGVAKESGEDAAAHRDWADQANADALKDAQGTSKDAQSALNSAQKNTGIPVNRPLSGEDRKKFSTPEERDGLGARSRLNTNPNPGKAFDAGGSFGRAKGIGTFMRRHRNSFLAGGGVVGIVLALILGFLALIPLQLIDMANLLLHHAQQDIEHEVDKEGLKVLKNLLLSRESDPGGAKQHTGHPLRDRIHNMEIKKFNDYLYQNGMKLTFGKDGRLTGIEYLDDEKNVDLTDASFTERRNAVKQLVSDRFDPGDSILARLSPWRILARVNYTSVMRAHARVSWRFWPKEKVKDILALLREKVTQGATPNEVEQETGKNPQQAQQETEAASEGSEAAQATETTFEKTGSKTEAIKAGIDTIKAHPAFGITGMVALICMVEGLAETAAKNGYIQRADLLIRAGNLIPTMASQLVTGQDFDITELSKTMAQFQGNPNAPPDSQDRLSWSQSAAAQRDMGHPVVTNPKSPDFNPDLSEAANPDGNALINLINGFTSIFNDIPGASFTCHILNSTLGAIVSIGLQVIEFAVNIVDGEAEEILSSAANLALQTALFGWVVPKALEAATGLAVTGTDNPVEMFNNGDAGLSLSAQDYARQIGGRELTNSEEAQVDSSAQNDDFQYAQSQGWKWNLFAVTNPNSLLSRVIINVPDSPGQAMADLSNVPHSIMTSFGTIFLGLRPASADTDVLINPYGFQFYGFTDDELDKYDPVQNEDVLTAPIPGHPGVTRLSMLGDPDKYDPDNGDDTDTNDLLHCFVNKYSDQHNGDGFSAPPGDICNGLGLVTTRDGSKTFNPSDQDIVNTIYCQNNNICNLAPNDDFLRYRLELLNVHILTALDCETTTEPCFTGSDADDD